LLNLEINMHARPSKKTRAFSQLTALVLCLGLMSLAAMASAADESAQTRFYDIPSTDLEAALNQFGREAGILLTFNSALVEGLSSTALEGDFSVLNGLQRLLSQTGLQALATEGGGYRIIAGRSARPLELDTIMITGELIERNLQDSQTSAVVISQGELEDRAETTFRDVVRRTPGVAIFGNLGGVSIRGVNENGPSGTGGGKTVTVSSDGTRLSDLGSLNISTWDVRQVEILRGPQSTQSGRNALAGSVTVLSNDPSYDPEYRVRLGLGNNDTQQGAFVINMPLAENRLAFRLAAEKAVSDGFISNDVNTEDGPGATDLQTARASLRFDPTTDLSFVLKYTSSEAEGGTQETSALDFPDLVTSTVNPTINSNEYDAWNLTAKYDIGQNASLEYRLTFTDSEGRRFFDDGVAAPNTGTVDAPSEVDTREHEIRYLFEVDRLNGVLGLFYTDIDGNSAEIVDIDAQRFGQPPGSRFVSNSRFRSNRENYAVFGEAEYQVLPSTRLVFGARYDVEEASRSSARNSTLTIPGVGSIPISGGGDGSSATYEAFLPKLGVVYDVNADSSIGLSYQRGYRAGGSGTNSGVIPAVDFEFDPEYTDTIELAYRSLWHDGALVFNANAFFTKWKDQQVRIQGPASMLDRFITNAGKSEYWGGELDVRAEVTRNLSVFALAAYVQTEFTDFVSNGVQLAGNEFIGAPKLMTTLGADYEFDNGWRIGGDISYTDSSYSDVENTSARENDAHALTNVRAAYMFDNGVEVIGSVENLFDESYTTARRNPVGTDGTVTPGAPRTVSVFLRAEW
jgi:outer membrane receptor protein involved in Fe transport